MLPTSRIVHMTDEEFRLIRDFLTDQIGLFFEDSQKYIFEHRLQPRLARHALASYTDYYRFLRYRPERAQELEELADRLTNNETYFFREDYQLETFVKEVVPVVVDSLMSSRRLRVWSAGCSSGEEPYTLAILLSELPAIKDWHIEVFGNDISRKVLQHARAGVYGQNSFRRTPPEYMGKFFRPAVSGGYEVVPEIKKRVTFGHINLLDRDAAAFVAPVDVVFCRNVLIYFNQQTRDRVLSLFYDKLRTGGYLFLGHSENLISVTTDFELVVLPDDIVYKKPMVDGNVGA